MEDTIFALSSGIGRAGVAVIRASGPAAVQLPLLFGGSDIQPRTAVLSRLRKPGTEDVIDRGLMIFFPAPASFTGEDIVEFHVHGGRAVVVAMLQALSSIAGLRAAEPGEFTRRAFANGKLDLTSAEGLGDLIAADTELQRRRAIRQMEGAVEESCRLWRSILLQTQALIEAYLDFPDEEEIPGDVTDEIRGSLGELLESFRKALAERGASEIIRDGAVVLIAGPPNSGKSSLMNRIARRDVAIISEIPGTTRDLLEITVDLRGLPVTFVDSAGIRETMDPIESHGIERTRRRAKVAQLVLWLSPEDNPSPKPDLDAAKIEVVSTKIDLTTEFIGNRGISAATGAGLDELLDFVYDIIVGSIGSASAGLLASARQFEGVSAAADHVSAALAQLELTRFELVAEELRLASRRLAELTGEIEVEDLLDEVFGRFCLGK